jgi:fatty acid amide hydrolase 2
VEWLKWSTGRSNRHFLILLRETIFRIRGFVESAAKTVPIFRDHRYYDTTKFDVETLRNEFRELLGDDGVLLCPAHPTRVPYHGETFLKPFNFVYSAIFNFIGTPVTTVPLGLDLEGLPVGIQVSVIDSH